MSGSKLNPELVFRTDSLVFSMWTKAWQHVLNNFISTGVLAGKDLVKVFILSKTISSRQSEGMGVVALEFLRHVCFHWLVRWERGRGAVQM